MNKSKLKIVLIIMLLTTTVFLSGCTKKPTLDDCPCPEYDSDPTGGLLQPIGTLQNLEVNISGFIDFSEIVQYYGQVEGSELERTAMLNITITNNADVEETAIISLKNKSISWSYGGLFMDSKIWIHDENRSITFHLYTHRSWTEDGWRCSTYDFNDYIFTISANSNRTLILYYMLESQPSGSFMDGQIFAYPYGVFGVHIGENHERWQYYPIEVRT